MNLHQNWMIWSLGISSLVPKGKKQWLCTEDDVTEMLEKHKRKKEITLWCYSQSDKPVKRRVRSRSPNSKSQTGKTNRASKYDLHVKKMSEVDEIFSTLDKKHKGAYSSEQIWAWAHLIQLKKHGSYDSPPDKPFFRGRKSMSKSVNEQPGTPDGKAAKPTSSVSPSRKIILCTEILDQLQKWHALLESGAVTQAQYDELQHTILTDIKGL